MKFQIVLVWSLLFVCAIAKPTKNKHKNKNKNGELTDALLNQAPAVVTNPDCDDTAPEQLSGKFEGDINLPADFNPRHRNALANKGQLWPNGIVYYKIDSSYSSSVQNTIKAAMQEIQEMTKVGSSKCIQYVERTTQQDFIHFQPLSGCYSSVGRVGYEQELSLGRGCERKGTMMHEMLHALGFFHEQSRADRDDYVTIHYENVSPGRSNNFDKYSLGTQISHLGQPYDYGSIMHYSRMSFSKDGRSPTISPKQGGVTIGQRVALSEIDIRMIQLLYGCTVGTGPITPGSKTPTGINTGAKCVDKLDNCAAFGKASCTGDYEPWARENCEKYCDYCRCEDKLDNCKQYSKADSCFGSYKTWAIENCAEHCGYCGDTNPIAPTDCKDKLDNCAAYGQSSCVGAYEPWARDKCALTCKFCTPSVIVTTPTTVTTCEDKLSNCQAYGSSSCVGDYEPWARDKCPLTCGYCKSATTPPTTPPPECKDKLSNCDAYGSSACVGDYEPWARDKCPLTCGYCTECKDVLDNCKAYGTSSCVGDYASWAKERCALTCGFCTPTGTTTSKPVEVTTTVCKDKISNCKAYGSSSCSGDFEPWARDNCALFCGFCGTKTVTTVPTSKPCNDVRSDCSAYGKPACYGDFEPWARANCASFCGYCGGGVDTTTPSVVTTGPCEDKIPNCVQYGSDSCTGQFEPWARDKCAKTCGFCSSALFAATSCDFNGGFCGWKNSVSDNTDWRRRSGSSPTYATGPNDDYDQGGRYIYVEASGNSNKVAKLVSANSYPANTAMCVQFAYHMYGNNMGTLKLVAMGDSFYSTLLQVQGDQGNKWVQNNVNLSIPNRSFNLVFEAVVGNGPRSDIALDNVTINPGQCA